VDGMGKKHKKVKSNIVDLNINEINAIVEQTKNALNVEDHAKLKAAMATLAFLMEEIKLKNNSIKKLQQMLFGSSTENTNHVVSNKRASEESHKKDNEEKTKRPGHGRNGASAFTGANRIKVSHPSIEHGSQCPHCLKGKIYLQAQPSPLVRITGMAPLMASVYELDQLRCNLCNEVFTAPTPEGIGDNKYDDSATGMIGMLKYGAGTPFNRIEKLQEGMGIPLPASTQWELVRDGADKLEPVHEELVNQAAQGKVIHNDDTTNKILGLTREQRAEALSDEQADSRTGVYTSGIVSIKDQQKIALFCTGAKHAGENLAEVLARRNAELPLPIQMCDALSRNITGEFESILTNCNTHARRKYVDVADDFPDECKHVLEILRNVYKNDATARERALSDEERLQFHQAESGPLMKELEEWMKKQFEERKVEPNSGLGEAIKYMQKHWNKLTLFLKMPGVPLDNNICERAIKKVVLHRKNSYFYRTTNGARVGDCFMSIIHTAELNGVAPFYYLVALLRHYQEVEKAPSEWMPWNYKDTMARLSLPAKLA
jgi:hypothetical protein